MTTIYQAYHRRPRGEVSRYVYTRDSGYTVHFVNAKGMTVRVATAEPDEIPEEIRTKLEEIKRDAFSAVEWPL